MTDKHAGAGPVDHEVRTLIAKLREMQRPGAESDLTVMCSQAADALTELLEWRKLRDPVTLHVSLLRGVPARLDRATFLHCAGVDQLMQALQEADTLMGHDDGAAEWREKWAVLWPNDRGEPETRPKGL
jgi:hypothetical protein